MASSARHPDHQAQEVYYPRSYTAPGFSRRLEPIHGPAGFGASNQANKPSCDGSSAGNPTLGLKANSRPANQSRCECRVLPEAHFTTSQEPRFQKVLVDPTRWPEVFRRLRPCFNSVPYKIFQCILNERCARSSRFNSRDDMTWAAKNSLTVGFDRSPHRDRLNLSLFVPRSPSF